MNFGAILIGLSLLIISLPFVIIPFQQGSLKKKVLPVELIRPENERLAVLSSLRDLDFDYQIGKVNEEDYTGLRGRLVVEAAHSLQETEEVDEVEALIQARKTTKKSISLACTMCGEPIGTDIRFCPRCGTPVKVSCPSCGKYVKADDLFCSSCGNKISIPARIES